jgi:ABC-2 type transport system ATP-binding protein
VPTTFAFSRRACRARSIAATLTLVAALAACTSSKAASPRPSSTTTTTSCKPPAPAAVAAAPVAGTPTDRTITSFDGSKIRVHWFPLGAAATKPAPTMFMGPGWGSGGDTNTTTTSLLGTTSIKDLRDAGYNVVTWDPRGFGKSTGMITVDSVDAEARDVQRIIDWVAEQSGVQLDAPHDPRMGMVGASYGGGIQLVTAAIDCRVDAIVPAWAWHSLTTSLDKADTPKTGWGTLLYAAASGRELDPHITSARNSGVDAGVLSADDKAWFASRGPGELVDKVRVPTLFVQGTIDTLFSLDEAVANYRILRANNVPTAMLWACTGHGVCLTDAGDRTATRTETLRWLARYVRGDASATVAPRFAFLDQNGTRYTGADYPLPAGTPITADGRGTLPLVADGGSGPAHPAADNPDFLAGIVAPFTPAKATNAVNVPIDARAAAAAIVGAPKLRLTYRGTVSQGTRPQRVFAQLVDATTGFVVGNQITPIAVTLDGSEHTTTVSLETIAFTLEPGHHLVLQLVATTAAYARPQLGGSVDIRAHLALPVVTGITEK